MTTWRKEIIEAMYPEESFEYIEYVTLTDEQLDKEFNGGYGECCGVPFLLWTKKRVYYPVSYEGKEWVSSVPRNPCEEI